MRDFSVLSFVLIISHEDKTIDIEDYDMLSTCQRDGRRANQSLDYERFDS